MCDPGWELHGYALRHPLESKAALARHLAWNRPQVDRLLDLRHATRIDLIDHAFDRLNMNLVVSSEAKRDAR